MNEHSSEHLQALEFLGVFFLRSGDASAEGSVEPLYRRRCTHRLYQLFLKMIFNNEQ